MLKDRETGLPSRVYWDILKTVVDAVPKDHIWIDGLKIEPLKISALPATNRPAWCKGKEDRSTLQIRFEGQKASTGAGLVEDQKYVEENFVAKMKAVHFFDKGGVDWFKNSDEKNDPDGRKYVFAVEWILNLDAYANAAEPQGAGT